MSTLQKVLNVIHMTDPEHESFRDSNADAIQELVLLKPEIEAALKLSGTMKVKIYSFTEDTDSGTRSFMFGNEAALHAHMRKAIIDSYGDSVAEQDGKLCDTDQTLSMDDEQVLVHLNAGEIEEAFLHWKDEGSTCGHLDSYNWDEEEIEIPVPLTVQALVAAAALARRTFTDDPNDIEFCEARGIMRKDILSDLTNALAPFPQPEDTNEE